MLPNKEFMTKVSSAARILLAGIPVYHYPGMQMRAGQIKTALRVLHYIIHLHLPARGKAGASVTRDVA